MVAQILLTNQAPDLTPWPTPTFAARSGTWASYQPRLFSTPTFLARFRANWANSYWAHLKNHYAASTTDPMQIALTYLATGSTTNLLTAYNTAVGAAYSQNAGGNPFRCYADGSAFLLDWCWPDLTVPQRAALVSQLEGFTNTRKSSLNAGPTANNFFQLHENFNKGYFAYLIGALAVQGEPSSTDRAADMTHSVQNYMWWLAEQSDGFWQSYNYQAPMLPMIEPLWECASGQSIPTLSGNPSYLSNRWENMLRQMTPDLSKGQYAVNGDQAKASTAGYIGGISGTDNPDEYWSVAVAAGYRSLPVAAWLANAGSGSGTNWALPSTQLDTVIPPSWLSMIYYDQTATQTTPAVGLPLCKAFTTSGWVGFRSGWTLTSGSTDIIAQLYATFQNSAHPQPGPGHISIRRGMDELVTIGETYTGSPSNIYTNWSVFSFCYSCANFAPAGSATPDASGSATNARRQALSDAAYPASTKLIWFSQGGSAVKSSVTKFQESATEHYALTDHSLAWPASFDPLIYHRAVSFIPSSKLFVIRDTYTLNNPGRNRFNWWGRTLPTAVGDGRALITRGSSQATIQCMAAGATLTLFGGAGSEQIIDGVSWPVNTANCGTGKPVAALASAVAGQGRATFEVSSGTSDVVHAITIDVSGSTAPTYTLDQLKSLAPLLFGGPIMPGFTQSNQRATLDTEFASTRYLCLFTTVPNDDGTGGVEVSGGSYTRKAILTTDWNAASGGGPATKTNLNPLSFVLSTADWGVIAGWGWNDTSGSSGGTLRGSDYLGAFAWLPFTCTLASPGVITSPGHGFSNGDSVAVTTKYGGALPSTAGSWAGILTVANVTTNTFTVGVNTTSVGDGLVRKIAVQTMTSGQTFTFAAGIITVTLG